MSAAIRRSFDVRDLMIMTSVHMIVTEAKDYGAQKHACHKKNELSEAVPP